MFQFLIGIINLTSIGEKTVTKNLFQFLIGIINLV